MIISCLSDDIEETISASCAKSFFATDGAVAPSENEKLLSYARLFKEDKVELQTTVCLKVPFLPLLKLLWWSEPENALIKEKNILLRSLSNMDERDYKWFCYRFSNCFMYSGTPRACLHAWSMIFEACSKWKDVKIIRPLALMNTV